MSPNQTPVSDDDGTRYFLVKRSSEASLVRDPTTGEELYLPNDQLTVLEGASTLETAARGVDPDVRMLVRAVPTEPALGLLVDVADDGPLAVRTMLERYDRCESDLHGLLTVLTASGLLEETTVAGERGYTVSSEAANALDRVRSGPTERSPAESGQQ